MEEKDLQQFYNKLVDVELQGEETQVLICLSSYIPGKVRFQSRLRYSPPRVTNITDVKKIQLHHKKYYRYKGAFYD